MKAMHCAQSNDEIAVDPNTVLIKKRGLLLIDDDECFRTLFQSIADSKKVPAATYSSLADMHSVGALGEYDAVVLDYFLESFRGTEIAEYIDVFFPNLPVLVISSNEIETSKQLHWPACIHRFVSKRSGGHAIVHWAMEAVRGQLNFAASALCG